MIYTKWCEKLKDFIVDEKLAHKSGIPIFYENNTTYSFIGGYHNLIIDGLKKEKDEIYINPLIESSIDKEESFIVVDTTLNDGLIKILNDNNYKIINLNFTDNFRWNPLDIPTKLYKEEKKSEALNLLENIASYLIKGKKTTYDPFWENSAINYFIGLTLSILEEKDNVSLIDIYKLSCEINNNDTLRKEFLDSKKDNIAIYSNLSGILNAPVETRGGIISVFDQKMRVFINRESLTTMMEFSNFNMEDIFNSKTAVILNNSNGCASRLISIFIETLCNIAGKNSSSKNFNIIVNNFQDIMPINNFSKLLNSITSTNINFTIIINSLSDLDVYGEEQTNTLELLFDQIIYIYSKDITTLEKISDYCGYQKNTQDKTITPNDLKNLQPYEAIVIIPRCYPIKTILKRDK